LTLKITFTVPLMHCIFFIVQLLECKINIFLISNKNFWFLIKEIILLKISPVISFVQQNIFFRNKQCLTSPIFNLVFYLKRFLTSLQCNQTTKKITRRGLFIWFAVPFNLIKPLFVCTAYSRWLKVGPILDMNRSLQCNKLDCINLNV